MATVYAVASSKGGVGKTTTTVNLGATLASAGLSVAVVDGDIGMANLGDALGVDPDGATLHDVLAGDADVSEAIYEGPEGVAVVPGDTSIDGFRAADPENLSEVLDGLADYDYVLVDTGAGLSHDTVLPLGLADEVVLVSTTERDSLTDTEKTRQVVDRLGGTIRGVVLTSVDPDDPNAEEVADRLTAEVIEAIPVDPVVRESMRRSDPLPRYAPASAAASAYRALAATLTGEAIPTPEAVEDGDAADSATVATDTDPETADGDDTETTGAGDDDSALDAPEDDGTAADDALAADDTETDETAVEAGESKRDERLAVDPDEEGETTESEGLAVDPGEEGETTESEGPETTDADDTESGDASDSAGLRGDDALAADTTPSDDPLVADSADPDADAADEAEPVFTTSLVEEAEPATDDDHDTAGDTDEDTELIESDESEEDKDDDKGFLGRLLG